MSDINPGDVVTVYTDPGFSLGDEDSTPTDPSTVTLTWYLKGEPPTTWTWTGSDNQITRTETGKFAADIPIERGGKYYFRWAGDGVIQAAEESSFEATTSFGG